MKETFRDIKGYEGLYKVSDLGNVVRVHKGSKEDTLRKLHIARNGYVYIDLYKRNKRKKFYVHQLVAKTFLNNELNKEQVNHIDGNKLNNKLSNLEWATRSENMKHAYDNGLCGGFVTRH